MPTKSEPPTPLVIDDELRNKLKQMIERAKLLGHKELMCEFNGSGDDGQIDHIEPDPDSIEGLYELMSELLDAHGGNWVDNDGGGGEIKINTETGRVLVDLYYNVTSTEPDPKEITL